MSHFLRIKMRTLILLSVFLCSAIVGCGPGYEPPEKTTQISGTVVNESGIPLGKVSVSMDRYATETDESGNFFMTVSGNGSEWNMLSFIKDGHLDQKRVSKEKLEDQSELNFKVVMTSPSVGVLLGGPNQVENIMTKPGLSARFTNRNWLQEGRPYNGAVRMSLTEIDVRQNPKSGYGYVGTSAVKPLESFGTVVLSAIGENGRFVKPAQSFVSIVRIPAKARGSGVLPETSGLYAFNEGSGLWVLQGTADLKWDGEVAYYEGFTQRYGTLMAGMPFQMVSVSACTQDAAGLLTWQGSKLFVDGVDYISSDVTNFSAGKMKVGVKAGAKFRIFAKKNRQTSMPTHEVFEGSGSMGHCLTLTNEDHSVAPVEFWMQTLMGLVGSAWERVGSLTSRIV
jgi:hypothetical protein